MVWQSFSFYLCDGSNSVDFWNIGVPWTFIYKTFWSIFKWIILKSIIIFFFVQIRFKLSCLFCIFKREKWKWNLLAIAEGFFRTWKRIVWNYYVRFSIKLLLFIYLFFFFLYYRLIKIEYIGQFNILIAKTSILYISFLVSFPCIARVCD